MTAYALPPSLFEYKLICSLPHVIGEYHDHHPRYPRVANAIITTITYKYVGNGMAYPWVSDDA